LEIKNYISKPQGVIKIKHERKNRMAQDQYA